MRALVTIGETQDDTLLHACVYYYLYIRIYVAWPLIWPSHSIMLTANLSLEQRHLILWRYEQHEEEYKRSNGRRKYQREMQTNIDGERREEGELLSKLSP